MTALKATETKKLIRRFLDEAGEIRIVGHALRAMADDKLTTVDVENILRGGICREAEYENGGWRYQVDTTRIVVVITFDPEPEVSTAEGVDVEATELVVVTVWEIKKR